jgi:AcrR family transcriptional regulator
MVAGTMTRLPRAERRDQIIRAAAGVFVGGGFDGTSMDDVARAAGVTRLIVYRIFESKEALYQAVLQSVIDELKLRFDVREIHGLPRDAIAATLLTVARNHPDGFRLLWRHAAHEQAFSGFARSFRASVTEYAGTLLDPGLADPTLRRWAAESIVAHLYESICLWLDHGSRARDAEFLELLTGGIRATIAQWADRRRATRT